MISHTYFIIHPEHEPDRFTSIKTSIKSLSLTDYTIFTHTWGTDITPAIRAELCKTDISMKYHDRSMKTNPLSNGEISLFLNHIECLKLIRSSYKEGLFLIFESDVLFHADFIKKLQGVITLESMIDWDIINIGEGNGSDKPRGPINPYLYLYAEKRNRCTEGLLWNYKSICKFLDYYESTVDIDGPFDTKIDFFSEYIGSFNIYWAHPALVYQGSIRKIFKSHLH
jgi:GR25 family glycosyltransferase involved in LPS biosynthesis